MLSSRLSRSDIEDVRALGSLANGTQPRPPASLRRSGTYSVPSDHEDSTSASASATLESDQAPASTRWTQKPTPIGPPQRSFHPMRKGEHAVANWAATERVKSKARKLAPGDDAPSNGRRNVSGSRSGAGTAKRDPIVVPDDDDDEKLNAASETPIHALLGVQHRAPFDSKKQKHVDGALATDGIDDSDPESLIIDGDKNTRRTTPTRFPKGHVKLIVNALNVPVVDFSKSKPGLKSRMKPKGAPVDSKRLLMEGKNAETVNLGRRPRASDPGSAAFASTEASSSRFGSAMRNTLVTEVSPTEHKPRPEKIGPFKDDSALPRHRTTMPPSVPRISTQFGDRAKPSWGPAPLEVFCLGTERVQGFYMVAWDNDMLAFYDNAALENCAACIAQAELYEMQVVSVTAAKRSSAGGGAIIRLKHSVVRMNSTAFEACDSSVRGYIILKFNPPGSKPWTRADCETCLNFLFRFGTPVQGSHISMQAIDSMINAAVDLPSEVDSKLVAGQARLLEGFQKTKERKEENQRRRRTGEITSYLEKQKGKAVDVDADTNADAEPSPGSARKRLRDAECKDELADGTTDELDLFRDASSSGDDPWDSRRPVPEPEPVRDSGRRTRASARTSPRLSSTERKSTTKREPLKNPDEIILVFPKAGPGAINVSRADHARLEPGEFLNDTLIEFWLKYWLTTLDPVLAEQVHVFSSFFYKKLNQRNFEEGYASVRKWTNKVDIFKKKYIIVPINEHIHWYLAIIYQPEHVLKPPIVVKTVATRQRAAQLAEASVGSSENASRGTEDVNASLLEGQSSQEHTVTSDDPDSKIRDAPMDVDDTASMSARMESYSIEDDAVGVDPALRAMHTDGVPELSRDRRSPSLGSGLPSSADRVDELEVEESVALALPLPSSPDVVKLDTDSSSVLGLDAPPSDSLDEQISQTTYIFTFDSLGTKHPQVIKNLSRYLSADAQDKRGIPAAKCTAPQGKKVIVPTQPNFCDCGIYLLHFAETFMSDPARYARSIIGPTKKPPVNKNELWQNETVGLKRERMSEKLEELSVLWMQKKREDEERSKEDVKPTQAEVVEHDDDDEVCEVAVTMTSASKPSKLRAGRFGALE